MIWVELAGWSDVGKERKVNEDRVFYQVQQSSEANPVALAIVADGVGGHLGGKVASHWAVETLKQELSDLFFPIDPRKTVALSEVEMNALMEGFAGAERPSDAVVMHRLREAIERANEAVYGYAEHRPQEARGPARR